MTDRLSILLKSVAQISIAATAGTMAAAMAIALTLGGTPGEAVIWGLLATLATRAIPILASFPLAYWPRPGDRVPVLGAAALARTMSRELWATAKLYFFYHAFERMMSRREPRRVVAGERPLLLVHGFFANAGFWYRMKPALQAAGWHNVFSMNLEPPFASIDDYVLQLQERIEYVCRRSASDSVVIVAHSMGGLVARACAQRVPQRVRRMICLGTPHHGTVLALLVPWENTRQMRPGSAWLQRLNLQAVDDATCGVPVTNIYSEHDNIIIPQRSAALRAAENLPLEGVGHLDMAFSPVLRERLLNVLARERRAGRPAGHPSESR